MKNRKLLVYFVVVIGTVTLFLFFDRFMEKTKVGVLLPIDDVESHTDGRVGFLYAMKKLPKDVDFIDVDYTSTSLKKSIENAAKKGIKYFVCDGYSSDLKKIGNVLQRTHSILIESMVTNPIALKNAKYAFTLSPTDDVQASAIASYIMNMGYKSAVIVEDTTNIEYVEYLSSEILENLKSVKCEEISIDKIGEITKSPDIFVLVMSPENAIKVIRILKSKFPNSAFLGSDWVFNFSLLDDMPVVNGMVVVGFVDPLYLQTRVLHASNDDLPITPVAILSYDALKVTYILAKEKIKCNDVQKYLESHSFFGMVGTFTFDGVHATTPIYFYKLTPSGIKSAWKFGGKG